ncbi:inhibitory synaptic factor 2A [Sorex araneus]|uniref:inhibitory synaptic factor 2A n=1 Tax=Sorex araneus TaxID=42254 RepID=UPI00243389B5|nr:inhibitory synaptic factor 2A [Sorex araneus]XP_054975504.1 inhibitory synaptic factor 2A [Sorex araneus]
MVSKDSGRCPLSAAESELEPAACLALELRYALDPDRQIKKRNKALQVRFKDICEAQSEQRGAPVPAGERREAKPVSQRAAYRKYMTVPARRSIPNVTRSTGVQTSPDLRKCYQTFPPERRRGALKGLPAAAEDFPAERDGLAPEARAGDAQARPWGAGHVYTTAALVFHSQGHADTPDPAAGLNCAEPGARPDGGGCRDAPLAHAGPSPAHGPARLDGATPAPDREAPGPAPGRVFKTEVAAVYAKPPAPALANSAAASEWSLCPAAAEEPRRDTHVNGVQGPPRPAAACSPPRHCLSPPWGERPPRPGSPPREEPPPGACRDIVPQTEVGDLKAQLQVMENLICSSQETIKVLLGVIQELEKGEAHREGLSYRTGQDTANCDTCRNSACVIYSVELDFKQQEDKLQPVLRKLHPFEDTQVAPLPYSPESDSSTPKQKSKPESKKHGRWKLWFL